MARSGGRRRAQTTEDMEEGNRLIVRSLARALTILTLFDVEHPEWGLDEISRATGINKSTAYRILRTLEWKGFLGYDQTREKYHFGRAAIPGFYLSLSYVEIARVARPHLEELGDLTGETIELTVEGEGGAVVVDQVMTPSPFKRNQPIGRVQRDLTTSSMRVLVAFKSDHEQRRIMLSVQSRLAPGSVVEAEDLTRTLQKVAQDGFALDLEEYELGVCAVSAPITGPDGELRAVVTVVSPTERFGESEKRTKIEAVLKTSASISGDLKRAVRPSDSELGG